MPVTYKDEQQRRDVTYIMDDILDNSREDLMNNNVEAVYERILDPTTHGGRSGGMTGDRLGKITEELLDLYPELLHHLTKLPLGMFYGSDLTEITIPHNVTGFSQFVFGESQIRTITYEGTREEWINITRNSDPGWDFVDREGHKVGDLMTVNCTDAQNIYNVNRRFAEEFEKGLEEDFELEESMTKKEVLFKMNVLDFLRKEGFATFADYLSNFHFNFVTSKDAGQPFVAAMVPNKGIILINPTLDIDAVSMVLRHEAAHQIFKHQDHMIAKLKKMGINNPSELAHRLTNIAGDYHISNYIYDDDDKAIAKKVRIGDDEKPFVGLVTSLDFPENPEYWTMDFDQLWDVFVKKYNREDLEEKAMEQSGSGPMSDEFIEGWNALIDAYNKGEITKDQIERWYAKQGLRG